MSEEDGDWVDDDEATSEDAEYSPNESSAAASQETTSTPNTSTLFPIDPPTIPVNNANSMQTGATPTPFQAAILGLAANGNYEPSNLLGTATFEDDPEHESGSEITDYEVLNHRERTRAQIELSRQWKQHFEEPLTSRRFTDVAGMTDPERMRLQNFIRRNNAGVAFTEEIKQRIRCLLDSVNFTAPEFQTHFVRAINLELQFYFDSFRSSDPDPKVFILPDYLANYTEQELQADEPWETFSPNVDSTYHRLVRFIMSCKPMMGKPCSADSLESPEEMIKTTWLGQLRDDVFTLVRKIMDTSETNRDVTWDTTIDLRNVLTNESTGTYVNELKSYYVREFAINENYFKPSYTYREYVLSILRLIWLITYGFAENPFQAFANRRLDYDFEEDDAPIHNDRFKDFYHQLVMHVIMDQGDRPSDLATVSLGLIQIFHSQEEDFLQPEEHKELIMSSLSWLKHSLPSSSTDAKQHTASGSSRPSASFYLPTPAKRPKLDTGVTIRTHYCPSICSSSRSSFREQQAWNIGKFNILRLDGRAREIIILRYLLFEVQVVDNSGLFVKHGLLSILISTVKKSNDGLLTFFALILITELTEVQRILNECCTKNVLSLVLKVNTPSVATNGVVLFLCSIIFKCPEYVSKLLHGDTDQQNLVTKALKYLLWCVEKGYEEGRLTALDTLSRMIEIDKAIYDKFTEMNGVAKCINCIRVLKIVQHHCLPTEETDPDIYSPFPPGDLTRYDYIIGRTRLRATFNLLMRYLSEDIKHRFSHKHKNIFHRSTHRVTADREILLHLNPLLESRDLDSWPVVDKIIELNLLPVLVKSIHDGLTDGQPLEASRDLEALPKPCSDSLLDAQSALSLTVLMSLSDTMRQELAKDYEFWVSNREFKSSGRPEGQKVTNTGILFYLGFLRRGLNLIQECQSKTRQNELSNILVCCFNVIYYSVCSPVSRNSDILNAPATIHDETHELFNHVKLHQMYTPFRKSRPLKQPQHHENTIFSLWILLRRANILFTLKRILVDEKLGTAISKANEAGPGADSLISTILMTCVMILQGLARWEPCRAILLQMNLIEQLQVLKFKNSQDLPNEDDNAVQSSDEALADPEVVITKDRKETKSPKRRAKKESVSWSFFDLKTQLNREINVLIDLLCGHVTNKELPWKSVAQSKALNETIVRYNNRDVLVLIEAHLRQQGCDKAAKALTHERLWKKECKGKASAKDVMFHKVVKGVSTKSSSWKKATLHASIQATGEGPRDLLINPSKELPAEPPIKTPKSVSRTRQTPKDPNRSSTKSHSTPRKELPRTTLGTLLQKHVRQEYARNSTHCTTTHPEYRFTKQAKSTSNKHPLAKRQPYTGDSRNFLSRLGRMRTTQRYQNRDHVRNESCFLYNNFRPRQQMVAYAEGQPIAFHFATNDVAIVGDNRGNISTTRLPHETMEPECYQNNDSLLIQSENLIEANDIDAEEIYQITTSPLARARERQPLNPQKSLDWGQMPPYFIATVKGYGQTSMSAMLINSRTLTDISYTFLNTKWVEFSKCEEQRVLSTDMVGGGCKFVDLTQETVVQSFGVAHRNSHVNREVSLVCNKATIQPHTNDKVILSNGILYDARDQNRRGLLNFKLDVIDRHITNGVFHPYKPEIIRDDCIWDIRYLNKNRGCKIVKNIPELKGTEVQFSESSGVLYSCQAWVDKFYGMVESTRYPENTHQFGVWDSTNYAKLGSCPTKYPIYDLVFEDKNQHFLTIEKTGRDEASDLDESVNKYEMRFWQIGRRLRVKGEVGPYDFDQDDYDDDDTGLNDTLGFDDEDGSSLDDDMSSHTASTMNESFMTDTDFSSHHSNTPSASSVADDDDASFQTINTDSENTDLAGSTPFYVPSDQEGLSTTVNDTAASLTTEPTISAADTTASSQETDSSFQAGGHDTASQENVSSEPFNAENLMKLFRDKLDLNKIAMARMRHPGRDFVEITQILAAKLILVKYPDIEWSASNRDTLYTTMTLILSAIDKSMERTDVPQTIDELVIKAAESVDIFTD